MEHLNISQQESGLHIEGFPDATKVIRIEGPQARRLADLALHKDDLEFADSCLDAINLAPEDPPVMREALWRSAIVHFMKCFGESGARFQLSSVKILRNESTEALMTFNYLKHLRNKHIVHDENSYAQSLPGAILNDGSKGYKIEKIVCILAIAATLEQENYSNLKLLIQKSHAWVVAEYDQLCKILAAEFEHEQYDVLPKKKSLTFCVPTSNELQKNRHTL